MNQSLHIELITETYPPDVNGVALTVQALEQGLRGIGALLASASLWLVPGVSLLS